MFKVKVHPRGNAATFETMELAQAWINQEVDRKSFGKPHRFITSNNLGDEDISKAISSTSEENEFGEVIITYEFAPEYTIEIIDITEEHGKETRRRERIILGKQVAALCSDVYDYVTGLNVGRSLSAEQVTEMENTFAPIIAHLNSKRPWSAWPLVKEITVDGVLLDEITLQDIKDLFLKSGLPNFNI